MSETKSTSDESGDETPDSDPDQERQHEIVDDDPEDEQDSGFYATIEARRFKRLLRAVSAVVEECRLQLEPEGLVVQAVDGANVVIIDLSASAEVLEFYDATGGAIGADTGRLYEIARIADASDHLHLCLDQETRKLHVRIKELEYTLALIDPDTIRQGPDLPRLEFAAELTLPKEEFSRAVKAADMVANETVFSVDEVEEQFVVETVTLIQCAMSLTPTNWLRFTLRSVRTPKIKTKMNTRLRATATRLAMIRTVTSRALWPLYSVSTT